MAIRHRYVTVALLAALSLALVAFAGCGTAGTTTAAGSGATTNTVTASGAGTAQAVPDTAEMSFGVTTISPNASWRSTRPPRSPSRSPRPSRSRASPTRTSRRRTSASTRRPSTRTASRSYTGYQASLSVRVKVRDIAKLGEIISAANAAGANEISGPMFTIDDPAPARAAAIDEAVADARKTAEAMAEAAGKSVGEVLSMSSSDAGSFPMALGAAEATGAARDVPVEPGADISANVVVVFALE